MPPTISWSSGGLSPGGEQSSHHGLGPHVAMAVVDPTLPPASSLTHGPAGKCDSALDSFRQAQGPDGQGPRPQDAGVAGEDNAQSDCWLADTCLLVA